MLSIIVPVLNEAGRLPALLSDLRHRFPDEELIVVDGGSGDGSVAAALPRADVVLQGPAGRARQMNLGAAAASGRWLLFLHADSRLCFGGDDLKRQLPADEGWGFFPIRLVGRARALAMISWFMNKRSTLTSVATGDQALLVQRELFRRLGGFAGIPLMEDVEICKRLRRACPPLRLPLRVESSGRRWDEQGVAATILRMWALRLAYWCGVSPQRLWHHYYGRQSLSTAEAGASERD